MLVYDHGRRSDNKIALTFDDGPNPFWTVKILDLLDEFAVRANFFVLGANVVRYPDIIREVFDRGHLIGNHTYSHSKEGPFDFERSEKVIFDIIGVAPNFVRAPYLDVDRGADRATGKNGAVKFINADVFPHVAWNKKEIIDFVVGKTQNGSIILLHDGSRKEEEWATRPAEMFAALPEIIGGLDKKFEFARLDEVTFDDL